MPKISVPFSANFCIADFKPVSLSHFISAIVFLVPPSTIKSGFPNSFTFETYLIPYCSKGEKSVKFDNLGNLITAISIAPTVLFSSLEAKLSSSSISIFP